MKMTDGVMEEVNKSKSGGAPLDSQAISDAEKKKRLADNANKMVSEAEQQADQSKFLPAESLATASDKFVPPKTPQVVSGGLGSTAVPQQFDGKTSGINLPAGEPQEKFAPDKTIQEKKKGIPSSSEVPQQEDKGSKGI